MALLGWVKACQLVYGPGMVLWCFGALYSTHINPTPTSPPEGDENEIRMSYVADLLGSDHVVPTSTSAFDVFAAPSLLHPPLKQGFNGQPFSNVFQDCIEWYVA